MRLPKVQKNSQKRKGQGYGSGKGGHTSSRGQKGQKSRGSVHILFEGLKVKKSFLKRLPFKRGKGKLLAHGKPMVINLEVLNVLPDGATIDVTSLIKHSIVRKADAEKYGVKILGGGLIFKKFTVKLPVSKSAEEKITKAGGSVMK